MEGRDGVGWLFWDGFSVMGWDGVGWNEMEWDGVGWSGVEWVDVGWSRVAIAGSDGTVPDGIGWDGCSEVRLERMCWSWIGMVWG